MKQQNPKVLKLGEVYPGRVQFLDGNCGRVIDPYGREHFFHRDRYLKVKVRDGSVTFCSRKESGKLPSPQPCTWVYFMLGKDGQGRIRVHKFGPSIEAEKSWFEVKRLARPVEKELKPQHIRTANSKE